MPDSRRMQPALMSFRPAGPSAISVEVQSIGANHPMRRMPPHGHLFFELLVIVEGNGTLSVADREIVLAPRSVVALPPGVEHDCRRFGTVGGWSIIFLPDGAGADTERTFTVDERIPSSASFDAFRHSVREGRRPDVLGEDAFEAALTLIACMKRELDERPVGYDVMVRSALQMVLITVGRGTAEAGRDDLSDHDHPTRAFLTRVFAEIDAHFTESGLLRAAARRLDVQPGHLTTKVRRLTGRTYGTWVIERRMIEARRLLAQTDLSLAEIAERVGYAEIESFVRRFRRYHAMTPGSWRRGTRSKRKSRPDEPSFVESRSIGA